MSFKLQMTPEAREQLEVIMNDPAKEGLQKQIKKAFKNLSENPKHPGLHSHPLQGAEQVLGLKAWTSYVQNKTPSAHRILWAYSKTGKEIIILQVIPHY
ncbi:MAG TPA: hypothetical protein VI754_11380 [Bacteriovoracaceae bacterium]|nr:hypothetical protein [Bacteriovoracaceae bacterium]